MAETNSPLTPAPVQDKRTAPPGILPKNIQSWVLTGIAVVMITIIALTGRNAPKEKPRVDERVVAAIPNAERIQEYQKRIEDQTRKLQLEQAQLARTQAALDGTNPATQPAIQAPYRGTMPASYAPAETSPGSIQNDKRKREYDSLFASNIALSYRKEAPAARIPQGLTLQDVAQQPPSPEEVLARVRSLTNYPALVAPPAGNRAAHKTATPN